MNAGSLGNSQMRHQLAPWSPPVLRWAGSKRRALPHLMNHLPSWFDRYIEPFAGSACLFFAIKPTKAVLGDINDELMYTYGVIRDHPRLVARGLLAKPRSARIYYGLRSKDPEQLEPVARAVRFMYLNRYCFNGVYRTNARGHFNVPMGTRTGSPPDERALYRASIALRRAELRICDFETCVAGVRPGDFVYLDPPYATSRPSAKGEYGAESFTSIDIARLFAGLVSIDSANAVFLLSYSETPELTCLIPRHWEVQRLSVRRHVAGFSRCRNTVPELLITNAAQGGSGG